MLDSDTTLDDAPLGTADWSFDNDRGLAHAAAGNWEEAVAAFSEAADTLEGDQDGRPAAHEPLALVLGNLAQASFRAGQADDAIYHAQRSCALRVAIAGEDGMPVARARTDLAVMLAASGRGEEALMLIQRAMAGMEHRVGDDDVRLSVVLENAARIALSRGAVAGAEPVLLRLHALLHSHGLPTDRADTLLERIAGYRQQQQAMGLAPLPIEGFVPVSATPPLGSRPVGELLVPTHLTLDDLEPLSVDDLLDEPLDAPIYEPPDAPTHAERIIGQAPVVPVVEAPAAAHAVAADVVLDAPFDDVGDVSEVAREERHSGSVALVGPVITTSSTPVSAHALDRSPMLVMPTMDAGSRAMKTPMRGSKSLKSASRSQPAIPTPVASAALEQESAPSVPVKPTREIPALMALLIVGCAGGGLVAWLLFYR